jgi:hypothetical protein
MPDPEVLTLNPATGTITAEPCPLLHHTIGLDAPAAFYCRIHGRYESLAKVTINRHVRSSVTLFGFGRLLLAAVAPDCTTRRRLWRGFEDEYKNAVRRAPKAMRPIVSYSALTQTIAQRASLRACLAAVAAYPDQLEPFSEAHPEKVSEPASVTLDRTTGILGIAGEPPVHIPIGQTIHTNRFTCTKQPVIAPCAEHGWEVVTMLPRIYALMMRRESLRDYAISLIAATAQTCDEFAVRLSALDEVKPPSAVPSSTLSGYGPASFLTYAKLYARATLTATADYPEFTLTVLERAEA